MEAETDSALMRRVDGGETDALAFLFERHHVALFRYLLHLTGNRELSEDLVQEVFLRLLKYSRTYDHDQSFAVWIYGMARNAYFDARRKQNRERPSLEIADVASAAMHADDLIAREQDVNFVRQALERLPEEKREVLVLSRFHGMRYQEIARLLHCETGAIKVRVYRALKELRGHFCELRGEKLYDV